MPDEGEEVDENRQIDYFPTLIEFLSKRKKDKHIAVPVKRKEDMIKIAEHRAEKPECRGHCQFGNMCRNTARRYSHWERCLNHKDGANCGCTYQILELHYSHSTKCTKPDCKVTFCNYLRAETPEAREAYAAEDFRYLRDYKTRRVEVRARRSRKSIPPRPHAPPPDEVEPESPAVPQAAPAPMRPPPQQAPPLPQQVQQPPQPPMMAQYRPPLQQLSQQVYYQPRLQQPYNPPPPESPQYHSNSSQFMYQSEPVMPQRQFQPYNPPQPPPPAPPQQYTPQSQFVPQSQYVPRYEQPPSQSYSQPIPPNYQNQSMYAPCQVDPRLLTEEMPAGNDYETGEENASSSAVAVAPAESPIASSEDSGSQDDDSCSPLPVDSLDAPDEFDPFCIPAYAQYRSSRIDPSTVYPDDVFEPLSASMNTTEVYLGNPPKSFQCVIENRFPFPPIAPQCSPVVFDDDYHFGFSEAAEEFSKAFIDYNEGPGFPDYENPLRRLSLKVFGQYRNHYAPTRPNTPVQGLVRTEDLCYRVPDIPQLQLEQFRRPYTPPADVEPKDLRPFIAETRFPSFDDLLIAPPFTLNYYQMKDVNRLLEAILDVLASEEHARTPPPDYSEGPAPDRLFPNEVLSPFRPSSPEFLTPEQYVASEPDVVEPVNDIFPGPYRYHDYLFMKYDECCEYIRKTERKVALSRRLRPFGPITYEEYRTDSIDSEALERMYKQKTMMQERMPDMVRKYLGEDEWEQTRKMNYWLTIMEACLQRRRKVAKRKLRREAALEAAIAPPNKIARIDESHMIGYPPEVEDQTLQSIDPRIVAQQSFFSPEKAGPSYDSQIPSNEPSYPPMYAQNSNIRNMSMQPNFSGNQGQQQMQEPIQRPMQNPSFSQPYQSPSNQQRSMVPPQFNSQQNQMRMQMQAQMSRQLSQQQQFQGPAQNTQPYQQYQGPSQNVSQQQQCPPNTMPIRQIPSNFAPQNIPCQPQQPPPAPVPMEPSQMVQEPSTSVMVPPQLADSPSKNVLDMRLQQRSSHLATLRQQQPAVYSPTQPRPPQIAQFSSPPRGPPQYISSSPQVLQMQQGSQNSQMSHAQMSQMVPRSLTSQIMNSDPRFINYSPQNCNPQVSQNPQMMSAARQMPQNMMASRNFPDPQPQRNFAQEPQAQRSFSQNPMYQAPRNLQAPQIPMQNVSHPQFAQLPRQMSQHQPQPQNAPIMSSMRYTPQMTGQTVPPQFNRPLGNPMENSYPINDQHMIMQEAPMGQ